MYIVRLALSCDWYGVYPNRGARIEFSGTLVECLAYRKDHR